MVRRNGTIDLSSREHWRAPTTKAVRPDTRVLSTKATKSSLLTRFAMRACQTAPSRAQARRASRMRSRTSRWVGSATPICGPR